MSPKRCPRDKGGKRENTGAKAKTGSFSENGELERNLVNIPPWNIDSADGWEDVVLLEIERHPRLRTEGGLWSRPSPTGASDVDALVGPPDGHLVSTGRGRHRTREYGAIGHRAARQRRDLADWRDRKYDPLLILDTRDDWHGHIGDLTLRPTQTRAAATPSAILSR